MYIPKSRRKDEESPFCECTNPKNATKIEHKFNEASRRVLKEKGVLPVHMENPSKSKVSPMDLTARKGSNKVKGQGHNT